MGGYPRPHYARERLEPAPKAVLAFVQSAEEKRRSLYTEPEWSPGTRAEAEGFATMIYERVRGSSREKRTVRGPVTDEHLAWLPESNAEALEALRVLRSEMRRLSEGRRDAVLTLYGHHLRLERALSKEPVRVDVMHDAAITGVRGLCTFFALLWRDRRIACRLVAHAAASAEPSEYFGVGPKNGEDKLKASEQALFGQLSRRILLQDERLIPFADPEPCPRCGRAPAVGHLCVPLPPVPK